MSFIIALQGESKVDEVLSRLFDSNVTTTTDNSKATVVHGAIFCLDAMTIHLADISMGVRISFHHANPHGGNESFLLRFDRGTGETACLLVDAGHGVDLDTLLKPTDRLVALCLTHAHLDHYSSLAAAHRHDAPILTSPATAAVLADVFDVAAAEYDIETTDDVTDAISPIDDWTEVAPNIDIHPVPAGHVAGGAGFLIRVTDGDQSHHLLATGDFTARRAAGFPGFDAGGFVDIDVVFLTAATNDDFEASLTDALGTALEHAHGGAPTLVTTSGLVGVHIAYLLSALVAEFDLRVPIRVVGQVAKLYDALEYDCPGVEAVPTFRDTAECLGPGVITIAGPEVPTERSSGRLFGVLKQDPNACVVQLIGSGNDPLHAGGCTVHDYELINHPTRGTLVTVHDTLEPIHTVITHQHGGAQGDFNDLSSVVWGSGDTDEYTLYEDRSWQLPPWMPGRSVSYSSTQSVHNLAGAELLATFSVPSLNPHEKPDLEAEGIDMAKVATLLHHGPDAAASPDAPAQRDTKPLTEPEPPQNTTLMTGSNPNQSDSEAATSNSRPSTGLVSTTGADFGNELDPAWQAALEEGSLTEADLEAALDAQKRASTLGGEEESQTETPDECDSPDTPEENEVEEVALSQNTAEVAVTDDAVTASGGDDISTGGAADSEGERATEPANGVGDESAAVATAEGSTPPETDSSADTDVDTRPFADSGSRAMESEETMALELSPLVVMVATRAIAPSTSDSEESSAESVLAEAVDRYVVALLAGEASGTDPERLTADVVGSEAVESLLSDVVAEDARFASTAELVAEGLALVLGGESSATRTVHLPASQVRYLDAIRANEQNAFNEIEEIVEAAVAWSAIAE